MPDHVPLRRVNPFVDKRPDDFCAIPEREVAVFEGYSATVWQRLAALIVLTTDMEPCEYQGLPLLFRARE